MPSKHFIALRDKRPFQVGIVSVSRIQLIAEQFLDVIAYFVFCGTKESTYIQFRIPINFVLSLFSIISIVIYIPVSIQIAEIQISRYIIMEFR